MEDLCFLEEWQNFDQLQPLSLRLLPKLKPETAPILDYVCDEAAAGKHLRKAHLLLPYLHLLRQHGHNLLHKLLLVEPDPLPLPCARLWPKWGHHALLASSWSDGMGAHDLLYASLAERDKVLLEELGFLGSRLIDRLHATKSSWVSLTCSSISLYPRFQIATVSLTHKQLHRGWPANDLWLDLEAWNSWGAHISVRTQWYLLGRVRLQGWGLVGDHYIYHWVGLKFRCCSGCRI